MKDRLAEVMPTLRRAEHFIYVATAVILTIAAGALMVAAIINAGERLLELDYIGALLKLIDRVLLVLMLAEIIYTVRRVAQYHKLEAHPFFIIAIIAAIRRMLVITVESATHLDIHDPVFQALMAELALLALIILALAAAMRIIPTHLMADTRSDGRESPRSD